MMGEWFNLVIDDMQERPLEMRHVNNFQRHAGESDGRVVQRIIGYVQNWQAEMRHNRQYLLVSYRW